MSIALNIALAIIAFAAAFHLHWALGGRTGYSVSLPQRGSGEVVMSHRLHWWRAGAAGVAVALGIVAGLALGVAGHAPLPVPMRLARSGLIAIGLAFVARAIIPTPWTGFFKSIRNTRWALYDTRLYSPLFLTLGAALLAVAGGY